MFTGIVEATGEVVSIEDAVEGRRIRVSAPFSDSLEHGQSVAVSGACLTVEASDSRHFELFLSEETLQRTYLDAIDVGDRINLERALAADGRFDGHFVQGHVDGVGEVTTIEQVGGDGGDWTFGFSLPPELRRYVVEKGSIAVDGISLTVADLRADGGAFEVAIIPTTYDETTLSEKSVGDPVHLEVDVVAKYVERLTEGYL